MAQRKDKLVRVTAVEILPPEVRLPASLPTTAAEMDRRMEQKFAELLARRDDGIIQPYFHRRRVYQEFKRLLSVPEQRKWSVYFCRFGCTRCKTKKRPHSSCGMCLRCKMQVAQQLKSIVKELSKGGEP